jgi:hypothetical protein
LRGVRQKVKTYFLPVQLAKKDRQSLPFFGEKATQPPRPRWFFVVFTRFEGWLCQLSNPN